MSSLTKFVFISFIVTLLGGLIFVVPSAYAAPATCGGSVTQKIPHPKCVGGADPVCDYSLADYKYEACGFPSSTSERSVNTCTHFNDLHAYSCKIVPVPAGIIPCASSQPGVPPCTAIKKLRVDDYYDREMRKHYYTNYYCVETTGVGSGGGYTPSGCSFSPATLPTPTPRMIQKPIQANVIKKPSSYVSLPVTVTSVAKTMFRAF